MIAQSDPRAVLPKKIGQKLINEFGNGLNLERLAGCSKSAVNFAKWCNVWIKLHVANTGASYSSPPKKKMGMTAQPMKKMA